MTDLTPPSVMGAMQRMNRANLRSRAQIQREETDTLPGGVTRKRWVNRLQQPLLCRVSAPSVTDQEALVAAKVEVTRAVVVIFEAGADVLLSDRFLITQESGNIIIAFPVGSPLRDAEIMRKVLCEVRAS